MVDAVLLVLREVVEAALMFSLLLALSRQYAFSTAWCLWALVVGILGSGLLARYAYEISDAVGGTGQELLNAFLFGAVALSFILLAIVLLPVLWGVRPQQPQTLLLPLFTIIVSFSLMREGSEIWIYLSGYARQPDALFPVLLGAAIGTGIGLSLGAISYYLLVLMREKLFLPIFLLIATLLAGGSSMQIAKQLLQIGWLDSGEPLWDSSFIVTEQSWLGELLYALLGYDAQPTPIQIIFYISAIAPIVIASIWLGWRFRGSNHA